MFVIDVDIDVVVAATSGVPFAAADLVCVLCVVVVVVVVFVSVLLWFL